MKVVFGYSTRAEQMRFMILSVSLFVVSWLLLELSWMVSLFVSGLTAGAYVLAHVLYRNWQSSILVDDHGIEARRGRSRVRIAWSDVALVDLTSSGVRTRRGVVPVRHALVADGLGRRVAFADLSLLARGREVAAGEQHIFSIGEPEVLLALVARRTGHEELLPPLSSAEPETSGVSSVPPSLDSHATGRGRRVDVAGLGALAFKLGSKLFKAIAGLLKTVKPGFALVSGAVFAVFFDWKFVVGIMVMLLVHEMGHVWAMRRCGLPVRGIYYLPLLGAAAVTDDVWRHRSHQAYIALNGPLWGLYLTAPVLLAYLIGGRTWSVLGALAAWWSLVNLFNLLPINPLDGGRLLNAIGHSLHSWVGAGLSIGAFLAAFALSFWLEIELLVIVGIFGLLEFIGELESWGAMRRLRAADLGTGTAPEALHELRLQVRPAFGDRDERRLRSMEEKRIRRLLAVASIEPMPPLHTMLWGALYLALAAVFVAVMLVLAHNPAASLALDVLR
jgi:Zn-dependent protease